MISNPVKTALKNGKVQIGTYVEELYCPQLPDILASAGFDFMYIDMEHSSASMETVGHLCSAALAHDLIPIVRPPAKEPHLLSRPLDVGAMGLLIPHVDTAEEARKVVRAVKYPPMGERGFKVPNVHGRRFAVTDPADYTRAANEETLLIVQIESRRGLRNLDAILSVNGVDGAVIGRGDLSADLGLMGQMKHPEVNRRVEMMIRACRRRKKIAGLLVPDVQSAKDWIDKGIRLVPYSNEVTLLRAAAAAGVREIRAHADGLSARVSKAGRRRS
jgi:2-keto-3-deoxy-L-rhamnonate aldolase RhmA